MAEHPLHQLVLLTRRLRDRLIAPSAMATRDGRALRDQFVERTGQTTVTEYADAVALAAASAMLATQRILPRELPATARQWLRAQSDPLTLAALMPCLDECSAQEAIRSGDLDEIRSYLAAPSTRLADCLSAGNARSGWEGLYFLETFLHQYHAPSRRKRGVYYTPVELASFLVRQVDTCLRTEFGCPLGLADPATWQQVAPRRSVTSSQRSFVRTLDPAMGTGVFLLSAFDLMRATWSTEYVTGEYVTGNQASAAQMTWSEFVSSIVLPRLAGQDLMLSAVVVARLLLTARLVDTGYDFRPSGTLELHCGNTLLHPRVGHEDLTTDEASFTVIWGNPPFSGLSEHRSEWIRDLMRGKAPGNSDAVADYFRVDDQPLAERKHWLDDDYVKFLRVAHWLVERADCGVVGLVSNHGYLDNITFRGLRQQLLKTFSRVSVLDLHGNSRAGERAPDGAADESVFGIEQGVAVSLLCRPPIRGEAKRVEHGELWGGRDDKLSRLARCELAAPSTLEPHSPYYLFVPRSELAEHFYLRGARLCDVMPISSTAPVTARDGLVVAMTAEELHARLQRLADPHIADDEIRQQFFPSPRTTRYPAGDTRSWQLPEARARLCRESNWVDLIRQCQYRPFDRRWIFWAKWMIDWSRDTVVRHLTSIPNLALIARRQSPASLSCDFFWITDVLALDGLIRSDNRGSESIFPLFVAPSPFDSHIRSDVDTQRVSANFTRDFVQQIAQQLERPWCETTRVTIAGTLTPSALFHYIYALFHAPSYRKRFAPWLRQDFPRVFVPADALLFDQLGQLGDRLIRLHLMRDASSNRPLYDADVRAFVLKAPYPRWSAAERIELAPGCSVGPVNQGTWEYRVGAHQVCQKWMKDRQGRALTARDLEEYARMVAAIDETRRIAEQIDMHIRLAGDWPRAFVEGTGA